MLRERCFLFLEGWLGLGIRLEAPTHVGALLRAAAFGGNVLGGRQARCALSGRPTHCTPCVGVSGSEPSPVHVGFESCLYGVLGRLRARALLGRVGRRLRVAKGLHSTTRVGVRTVIPTGGLKPSGRLRRFREAHVRKPPRRAVVALA